MKIEAKEVERRIKAFSQVCRSSDVRTTHQRTEIYRELAGTDEHPDAETIYAQVRKRIPEISLDTVYRTLRMLERNGIISRVGSLGERTRFDANTDRHHHFVCTQCGLIADFHGGAWNDLRAPGDVKALGTVNSVHTEFRGLCNACQRRKRQKG